MKEYQKSEGLTPSFGLTYDQSSQPGRASLYYLEHMLEMPRQVALAATNSANLSAFHKATCRPTSSRTFEGFSNPAVCLGEYDSRKMTTTKRRPSYAISAARMGRRRILFRVAAKIALQTAGAIGGTPTSPTPPGRSALGTMWTSMTGGASSMRRTS